jgi:hypothetical protein
MLSYHFDVGLSANTVLGRIFVPEEHLLTSERLWQQGKTMQIGKDTHDGG